MTTNLTRRWSRRARLAAAAGLAITLTGCGSDSASAPAATYVLTSDVSATSTTSPASAGITTADAPVESTTASTEPPTTVAATSTTPGPLSDRAAATASLIGLDDLPSGYSTVPSAASGGTNGFAGLPACSRYAARLTAADANQTASETADFKNDRRVQIGDEVDVYNSANVTAGVASAVGDAGFGKCLKAAFEVGARSGMLSGERLVSIDVLRVPIKSAASLGVDTAVAYVLDSTVAVAGQRVVVRSGFVALTAGRAMSSVSLIGLQLTDLAGIIDAGALKLHSYAPNAYSTSIPDTTAPLPASM